MSADPKRIANLVLRWGAAALARLPGGRRSPEPQNILVVRLGNLGDIVVSLPTFHAIRKLYPKARIILLTSPTRRGAPGAPEVLERDATFDERIVYYADEASALRFLRTLRQRIGELDIDFAIFLPGELARFRSAAKYLALFAVSGVRHVEGFRLIPPEGLTISEVERLMSYLAPLGATTVEPKPWLHPAEEDVARARTLLAGAEDKRLIGMQSGAVRPANRWPEERFIELGRRLCSDPDIRIALTGAEGDREANQRIAQAIGASCIDLSGQTTIAELAAVLQCAALLVSNDTGTMHVAAAVGTPVVAIFSARYYPHIWYPYGDQHIVLRKDIECSLCQDDVCLRYQAPECLARISVDEVYEAVASALRQAPPLAGQK